MAALCPRGLITCRCRHTKSRDAGSDFCSNPERSIGSFSRGGKLALPSDNDFPALSLEQANGPSIAGDISIELLDPEFRIAFQRGGNLAARMTMPEALVDEHNRLVLREHNIRLSRKVLAMEPEPKPKSMQSPAQGKFRRRVKSGSATSARTASGLRKSTNGPSYFAPRDRISS